MIAIFVTFLASSYITAVIGQACQFDGYFPDPNQCDAYIQCIDGNQIPGLCPDGLVFDVPLYASQANILRCTYPFKIDCSSRPALQPAQPTDACPRQFGMYADPNYCGSFYICVDGKSHGFSCPEGLAFNDLEGVCDWPDRVDRCNSEDFLGVTCPAVTGNDVDKEGLHPKYPTTDCKRYIFCVDTIHPRLGICGDKQAYDPVSQTCKLAEDVSGCENYYEN